jgi:hypothetical protein
MGALPKRRVKILNILQDNAVLACEMTVAAVQVLRRTNSRTRQWPKPDRDV